ncbi:MAG: nucleotidyltransferase domain-containing protein [Methanobrevibacter sp. CfCl-M3]
MIQVSDEEMKIIMKIIEKHAKDCEVVIFGSRLKGTTKTFADLDLAFKCERGLGLKKTGILDSEFDESDLPYRVDIVDYNKTSKEFQKIIDKNNQKIYG